jgi:hypothetical protein
MDKEVFEMEKIDIAWCPGCGNFMILKLLKETFAELMLIEGGFTKSIPKTSSLTLSSFFFLKLEKKATQVLKNMPSLFIAMMLTGLSVATH